MKLRMLGDVYFRDIARNIPVGIPTDVSREFLLFAKDTCNAARRDICFAYLRHHPEKDNNPLLDGIDAMCYPTRDVPFVLVFIRPDRCDETTALHELMHVYL